MKTLAGLLLLVCMGAPARSYDPAERLYEKSTKLLEKRRLEAARAMLQTLIHEYPYSPRAADARMAIDATLLFEEAEERLKAGQYGTARVAFETLIAVYPETCLAKPAAAQVKVAQARDEARPRILVRSIRFDGFDKVPVEDILKRFREREAALRVEAPYDPRDLEEARALLLELLAERGESDARIEVEVHQPRPQTVEIRFMEVTPAVLPL
jgi:hypothetical protein